MSVEYNADKTKFKNPSGGRWIKINGATHQAICRQIRQGLIPKSTEKSIPPCPSVKNVGRPKKTMKIKIAKKPKTRKIKIVGRLGQQPLAEFVAVPTQIALQNSLTKYASTSYGITTAGRNRTLKEAEQFALGKMLTLDPKFHSTYLEGPLRQAPNINSMIQDPTEIQGGFKNIQRAKKVNVPKKKVGVTKTRRVPRPPGVPRPPSGKNIISRAFDKRKKARAHKRSKELDEFFLVQEPPRQRK